MGVRINGSLQPVAQAPTIEFDPQRGAVVKQRFESAGNNLAGLANTFQAERIAYSFEPSKFKSILEATATGAQLGIPEVICDTWQVLANEIQKDGKEHPKALAVEEASPGSLGYMMRDVDLYNQGKAPGSPSPAAGLANLFWLIVKGSTHYALSQYVLKHTTNVSNDYDVNQADLNIGKLYTPAQLFAEVTDPRLWVFPLPGRLVYKLQMLSAPVARTGYLWSWRKLASPETNSALNRVEINTEYWLEQWSSWYYDPVT